MTFSSSNAHQILSRIDALEQQSTGCETHRQFNRVAVRGELELTPMEHHRVDRLPVEVMLRDISRTGVSFVSQVPLQIRSLWRASLIQMGSVVAVQGLIIRNTMRIDAGTFLIGAQFCVENGLLLVLGLNPIQVAQLDNPPEVAITFEAPNEVI